MKRFALIAILPLAVVSALLAAPPAWWSAEGTRILVEEGTEENYAPANLGQLKHVAKQAKTHLDANLLGGSGTSVSAIVAGFVTGTTPEEIAQNYAPLNIGQLKAVAKPFYDRLLSAGYDTQANLITRGYSGTWAYDYPWDPATPVEENYAPANLGQLKMVFSFDLNGFDSDADGLPDGWELAYYGNLDSDGSGDWDGDFLSDGDEFQQGSDPADYYHQGEITISPYLTITGGDEQFGLPNHYLPNPLVVEVRSGSSTGALLGNAPVTYTVTSGSGALAAQYGDSTPSGTLVVRTGTNGLAEGYYRQADETDSVITVQTGTVSVAFSSHATQADGLASHWPFNEGTGTVAAEMTGLSVSGTLTGGVSWVERFDEEGAVAFSGSTASVSMGNPANGSLDLGAGSFSVALWVKYSDVTMASGEFYQRLASKGHKGWNGGYLLAIDEDGKVVGGIGTTQTGTSSEALLFRSTNAFHDDEWHHVALVVNTASKTARIYVDGATQPLEIQPETGGNLGTGFLSFSGLQNLSASNGGADFTVGSYQGTEEHYKGRLDDVRLYRRALSAWEITNLYNADADLNGLPDRWEGKYFGETGVDPNGNPDEDGLDNLTEYQLGTNPLDDDTDADGLPDGWEVQYGLDPVGTDDSAADPDGDGLTNLQEYQQESDPNDYYSQGSTTIAPVLVIAGGDDQIGETNHFLSEALIVEVRSGSSTGTLLDNAPVTYAVTSGGGKLATVFGGTATSETLEVRTGTNGVAEAWYRQGGVDAVESTILVQTGTAEPVTFMSATVDLVGHWTFEEGSGTVAADSAPFAFTGTLVNGPAWSERYTGESALSFSGSNDHVLVQSGSSTLLDFEEEDFSVVAWVKTGTAPVAGRLVSKGADTANAGYFLAVNAAGQFEAALGTTLSGTNAEMIHIKTSGSFNDETWHAVAAVYDRQNATARIYVDGTARSLVPEAGSGGTLNISDDTILEYAELETLSGARPEVALTLSSHGGTNAFVVGELDDVRVYRKALSAAEIEALYQEENVLQAVPQAITLAEDSQGTVTLQHQGGGNSAPVYAIAEEPENGTVTLEGTTVTYQPDADFHGTDIFRFRVTKESRTAEADITVSVTPVNDPPVVNVGGGKSIVISETLNLSGVVTDVDTPLQQILLKWRKTSGPGTVSFSPPDELSTEVGFSHPGEYVLKLIADDGHSLRADSLVVVVNAEPTESLLEITLEEPEDQAVFAFGAAISIGAETSVNGSATVSSVEFYRGSSKIGEATSPAGGLYSMNWTTAPAGIHNLSAKMTDSEGRSVFSNSVQVTVAQPPGGGGGGGNGGSGDPEEDSYPPYVQIPPDNPPEAIYTATYNAGTDVEGISDWYDAESGGEPVKDWKREYKVTFSDVEMSVPVAFSLRIKGPHPPFPDPVFEVDGATEGDSVDGQSPNKPYTAFYITDRITDSSIVTVTDHLKKYVVEPANSEHGERYETRWSLAEVTEAMPIAITSSLLFKLPEEAQSEDTEYALLVPVSEGGDYLSNIDEETDKPVYNPNLRAVYLHKPDRMKVKLSWEPASAVRVWHTPFKARSDKLDDGNEYYANGEIENGKEFEYKDGDNPVFVEMVEPQKVKMKWGVGEKYHAIELIPVEVYDDALNSPSVAWNGEIISLAQVQAVPEVNHLAYIKDNEIAWIRAHGDSSDNPKMPKLVARAPIPGASSLTYKWRLEVSYKRSNGGTQPADTVRIPTDGSWKSKPADQEWRIFEEEDWDKEINGDEATQAPGNGFFGGTAKLFLWRPGQSEPNDPVYEFRIAGENPVDEKCKTYIDHLSSQSPYTTAKRRMWYAYAIAKTESKDYNDGINGQQNTRYNQFWEKSGSGSDRGTFKTGDPLWIRQPDEPGAGGYGMFQVTGSVAGGISANIPREQLWNWQENVKAALEIIKSKRDEATYAVTDSQGNVVDGKSGAWDWMNDPQNRPGKSFPHGQRPQAKSWNGGVNLPVDVRVVEGVRFEDGTGQTIEDAVTIKMYNGASVMYCSWGGTAWSFNNTNLMGFDYVGRVCKEVEP